MSSIQTPQKDKVSVYISQVGLWDFLDETYFDNLGAFKKFLQQNAPINQELSFIGPGSGFLEKDIDILFIHESCLPDINTTSRSRIEELFFKGTSIYRIDPVNLRVNKVLQLNGCLNYTFDDSTSLGAIFKSKSFKSPEGVIPSKPNLLLLIR
tara:strand:+ start:1731 stop:2189 length:459 start_codon:yes stop_codon:yes gene_type:complete